MTALKFVEVKCDRAWNLGPRVRYVGGKTSPLNGMEGNIINFREGGTNAFVLFDCDPEHPRWVYGCRLKGVANEEVPDEQAQVA